MERRLTRFAASRRLIRTWEPIAAPQSQLSYWVARAGRRFSRRFTRKLQECELIASEWEAIRQLYRPGRLSPLDLARVIGMTPGGASKLVDRLVKKGLVRKTVGKFDRRCRAVSLTREGKSLVPYVAILEEGTDRKLFRKLRIVEIQRLMQMLKRMLGEDDKPYVDLWVSTNGSEGQWLHQHASLLAACMNC